MQTIPGTPGWLLWLRNLWSYGPNSIIFNNHVLFQEPVGDTQERIEPTSLSFPPNIEWMIPPIKRVDGYVKWGLLDSFTVTLSVDEAEPEDAGDIAEIVNYMGTRDLNEGDECNYDGAKFHLWAVSVDELHTFFRSACSITKAGAAFVTCINLIKSKDWQRVNNFVRLKDAEAEEAKRKKEEKAQTQTNKLSSLLARAMKEGSERHPLCIRGLTRKQLSLLFRFARTLFKPSKKLEKLLRFMAPDALLWPEFEFEAHQKYHSNTLTSAQILYRASKQGDGPGFDLNRAWLEFVNGLPRKVRRSKHFPSLRAKIQEWIKKLYKGKDEAWMKQNKAEFQEWLDDIEKLYLDTTELTGQSIGEGVRLGAFYHLYNELSRILQTNK